ncbi:MAG: hypothetical protein EBT15_07240 [Betaproteobacteria bacterium]|nr:hypothetical protein [Betaproteobacteria bacterium]
MSIYQILAVAALVAVCLYTYLPSLKWPAKKSILADIDDIVRIRGSYPGTPVVDACTNLLKVLLEVKP